MTDVTGAPIQGIFITTYVFQNVPEIPRLGDRITSAIRVTRKHGFLSQV